MQQNFLIEGPVGPIECRTEDLGSEVWWVLCHPHPLYGGSMDDAVLETVGSILRENQISHVNFNFRGVGRSAGEFDNGQGERDDLRAVVAYLESSYTFSSITLCGYSFGAIVIYAADDRISKTSRVVLIAPPVSIEVNKLKVPTDIVVGQHDSFCNVDNLCALGRADSRIRVEVVDMADHFFIGYFPELSIAIEGLLVR